MLNDNPKKNSNFHQIQPAITMPGHMSKGDSSRIQTSQVRILLNHMASLIQLTISRPRAVETCPPLASQPALRALPIDLPILAVVEQAETATQVADEVLGMVVETDKMVVAKLVVIRSRDWD